MNLLSKPHQKAHTRARDAWAGDLAKRQLDEKLGWLTGDPEYGGWGYAKELPRKPERGFTGPAWIGIEPFGDHFALEALRQAGAADERFSQGEAVSRALPELFRRNTGSDSAA